MNKSINIIVQLAEELQHFEDVGTAIDYDHFIDYLYHKKKEMQEPVSEVHAYGELHFLMSSIARRLKNDFTSLVKDFSISTYEEYSFIAHLQYLGSVRKMELVQMHMMSGTSGFDIIQKLLKNNLVKECPDPEDKRAIRIMLTKDGETLLEALNPVIEKFLMSRYASIHNIEELLKGFRGLIQTV